MEDYSKVEAEAHETPGTEDSSSSDSDKEEKVVSESARETEPGDSDAAELDATESETTGDSEVVLTNVEPKETTVPPADGSTVDGVLVASDNNAGNSSGFPESALEQNVEDSSLAETVPIVETRDGGGEVAADKPDIDETMETQPIPSMRHRLVQVISWRSCCGLFEVLRRSDR
ncbi:uncharacterized protein LOC120140738 [Hibiscus syriacus]|uniref:uncharacterized protein LOC120140738 n=1 Tax=Hibiscus syriacus TaxID=106335 RepID=UPI001924662A|nr:uncharacterized protein LOC120140738 [Hibiscus syriacus]